MSDIKIEHGTEADRAEVLALYKAQLGREFCPWTDEYPDNETIDWDLSRDALIVMKDEGKVIAAVSIEVDEDVEKLTCWNPEILPAGELARIAVLPERQGEGLSKKIFLYGMEELKRKGFKSMHLLVNKKNVKSLGLCDAYDFKKVGDCFMYEQDFWCLEKEL